MYFNYSKGTAAVGGFVDCLVFILKDCRERIKGRRIKRSIAPAVLSACWEHAYSRLHGEYLWDTMLLAFVCLYFAAATSFVASSSSSSCCCLGFFLSASMHVFLLSTLTLFFVDFFLLLVLVEPMINRWLWYWAKQPASQRSIDWSCLLTFIKQKIAGAMDVISNTAHTVSTSIWDTYDFYFLLLLDSTKRSHVLLAVLAWLAGWLAGRLAACFGRLGVFIVFVWVRCCCCSFLCVSGISFGFLLIVYGFGLWDYIVESGRQ